MRYFEIDRNEEGQRIDNFLLRILKNVPRSHVYRLLRSGQVRVNKGRIKPAYRLQAGDSVRLPPVRQKDADKVRPPDELCRRLLARIVYEDDDLLVIDKPAGLAVHGGSGLRFGLIESLRFARADLAYLELAHRLDRGTSGCLALAKSRTALGILHEGFRHGWHDKRYLALLMGAWRYGEKTVSMALQGQRLQGGERVVNADNEGRPAQSRFIPLEIWSRASLMEVGIGTGRMHQIRVHASEMGHPVAGDEKYGSSEGLKAVRSYGLRRMFLHAHKLKLAFGDNIIEVGAELPAELVLVIDRLREMS